MIDQTFYPTIALSASISSDIVLGRARDIGLWLPTITSAQVFLKGAFVPARTSPASADFVRIHDPRSQAAWFWNAGPGSAAAVLTDIARPFTHLRLETSVAQSAVRSLAIHIKLY